MCSKTMVLISCAVTAQVTSVCLCFAYAKKQQHQISLPYMSTGMLSINSNKQAKKNSIPMMWLQGFFSIQNWVRFPVPNFFPID